MEAKHKYSNDEDNRFMVFRAVQKLMATVILFVAVVVGCSKGDDGTTLVNKLNVPEEVAGNNEESTDNIGVMVTIKNIEPASPSNLKFGDSVAITYDYDVTRSNGARIWIQPFANDSLPSFNSYSPSPVFNGKGTTIVHFSIAQGDTLVVDQLKTKVNTAGLIVLGVLLSSDTLSESYESVNYEFTN